MWCNEMLDYEQIEYGVSMPHAAFYVVQLLSVAFHLPVTGVSMPHAAFYVVQLRAVAMRSGSSSFNAARSILCGATVTT